MSTPQDQLRELNPTQLIVLTFVAASFIGGILLKLPFATHGGISFIDALFTSTSAVCVTGLIVVDTGTKYTDFGKVVIMLLIQTGGLGITTYGVVFASVLTGKISLKDRAIIRESFAHFGAINFSHLVLEILVFTFVVELAGAILLFIFIPHDGFFCCLVSFCGGFL